MIKFLIEVAEKAANSQWLDNIEKKALDAYDKYKSKPKPAVVEPTVKEEKKIEVVI